MVQTDEERKAKKREYNQRPDVKAKEKARRQRPENKAKARAYSQRPDVKAKMKERNSRPEEKAKRKAYALTSKAKAKKREYYHRPDVKAKEKERSQRPERKARKKELSQRPENKAKARAYYHRPENKARAKSLWQRPENKAKKLERSRRPENKVKQKEAIAKIRLKVLQYYSKRLSKSDIPCCRCCGENSHIDFLNLDHIAGKRQMDSEPELIKLGYSSSMHVSKLQKWIIENNFPNGFQVLCSNCNFAKGFPRNKNKCPHQK